MYHDILLDESKILVPIPRKSWCEDPPSSSCVSRFEVRIDTSSDLEFLLRIENLHTMEVGHQVLL